MRKVILEKYSEKWIKLFNIERAKLSKIFLSNMINIYHIGSTAVTGIYAKPIIDIMVEVKNIKLVDNENKEMNKIGYNNLGEYGIKNRKFFTKGNNNRTFHVHIFEQNDKNILRHLAFRDYLISSSEIAKEYEKLKLKLSKMYPYDINKYMEGKNKFIKKTEKQAINWYKKLA